MVSRMVEVLCYRDRTYRDTASPGWVVALDCLWTPAVLDRNIDSCDEEKFLVLYQSIPVQSRGQAQGQGGELAGGQEVGGGPPGAGVGYRH